MKTLKILGSLEAQAIAALYLLTMIAVGCSLPVPSIAADPMFLIFARVLAGVVCATLFLPAFVLLSAWVARCDSRQLVKVQA